MIMLRVLFVGLAGSGLVGCAADDTARHVVFTDSAGIRIATNPAAAIEAAPVWRVVTPPALDIGVAEGDSLYQLYRVRSAVTLSTGEIAVLNNREIRIYDHDGTFVRRFGKDGDGPGEMRGPTGLWLLPGDSLLLFDEALRRATIFTPQGTIARATTLTASISNPELLAVFADGSLLVLDPRLDIPASGFQMNYTTYVRYTAAGALLDSLPQQEWGELGQIGQPGAMMAGSRIFAPRTVQAATRDAYWVAKGPPEITAHAPDGTLTHLYRWDAGDLSVSPQAVTRYREERLRNMTDDRRPARERQLNETPVADRFPASSRLRADASGRLWTATYRRPGHEGPAQWLVFGRDGAIAARAELPAGLILFEAGDDYVVGVERDDLDVEHLRRYTLTK